MAIKTKVILSVLFVLAAIMLAQEVFFSRFVIDEFSRLETRFLEKDLQRIHQGLASLEGQLAQQTDEWAKWDDTYDYMKSRSKKYQTANLSYESLSALNIEYLVYFDENGKVFDGYEVDAQANEVRPLSKAAKLDFTNARALHSVDPEGYKSGLLIVEGHIVLVAATAILDSALQGTPRGTLLRGSNFLPEKISYLSKLTGLPLTAMPLASTPSAFPSSQSQSPIEIVADDTIKVSATISDVTSRPVLVISFETSRPLMQQALDARRSITWVLILGSVTSVLVLYFMLRWFLVAPLERVGRFLAQVAETRNTRDRLRIDSNDELAAVAKNTNWMLDTLENYQASLVSARDVAQSANAAKSSFIAKVSHELRTPIHGILGMNRMVMKREKSRAIRELVKTSDDCARGLLNTINEILDFSKAESGNLTLERIKFRLRDVVRSSMQVISGRLEGKADLEVICEIDPHVPEEIFGDPTRLQQVLVNMLGNSVKFTEKGYVSLSISLEPGKDGNNLVLAVADTGIGIPADKLAQVFEPFKQADDTVTRRYQGTGLGLAIVKQFCDAAGGEVTASSTEGAGTTFTLRLPLGDGEVRRVGLDGNSKQWPLPLVVGADCHATRSLRRSLSRMGLTPSWVDSQSPSLNEDVSKGLGTANLLIVYDAGLRRSMVFDSIMEQSHSETGCTVVVVLNPGNLELRERLYEAGVRYILSTPVIAEDIVDAFFGKLHESKSIFDDGENPLRFERPLRVLLADDSATNRVILEDMLREAGHQTVSVTNGREMMEQLKPMLRGDGDAAQFDVVLTDIQMPIMDGITATRAIRDLEKESGRMVHIPILSVTAHAMNHEHIRMKDAGIDGVVTKPIEPEQLSNELCRILNATPATVEHSSSVSKTTVIELDLVLEECVRDTSRSFDVNVAEAFDVFSVHRRLRCSLGRTQSVLQVFNETFERPLEALEIAVRTGRMDDARKAAHSLRGLLLDIGAKGSGDIAAQLEQFSEEGNLQEVRELLPSLVEQATLVGKLSGELAVKLSKRIPPRESGSGVVVV